MTTVLSNVCFMIAGGRSYTPTLILRVSTIVSLTCDCDAKLSSGFGTDQVTKYLTIRGFRDDYYFLDADVVVLAGAERLIFTVNPYVNRLTLAWLMLILKGAMRFSDLRAPDFNRGCAFINPCTEDP